MGRPDSLGVCSSVHGNYPMPCCTADRRWVSSLVAVADPSSVKTNALLVRRLVSQVTLAGWTALSCSAAGPAADP